MADVTPEQSRLAAQRLDAVRATTPPDGLLYEYTRWVTHTTHAPARFHLASILPALAVEANRAGWRIYDHTGDIRPFKVLTALVGSTGVAKSTAIKKGKHFIEDWQRLRGPQEHQSPYLTATGSVSGIFHALRDRYCDTRWGITTAVLINDELTTLLRQPDLADNFNVWNEGEDVELHYRHLQKAVQKGELNDEARKMRKPVLSAVFASTEAALQAVVTQDQKYGGFWNRLLWVQGWGEGDERQFAPTPHPALRQEVLDYWHQHFLRWETLPWLKDEASGAKLVLWTTEARDELEKLFKIVSAKLEAQAPGVALIVRSEDHCIQVASLFALSRHEQAFRHNGAPTVMVTADDATRAVAFILACIERAVKIDSTVGVDEMAQLREFTLEKVTKGGTDGVTRMSLYRGKGRNILNSGNLSAVLLTLIDRDDIVEHQIGRTQCYWLAKDAPGINELNQLRGIRVVPG